MRIRCPIARNHCPRSSFWSLACGVLLSLCLSYGTAAHAADVEPGFKSLFNGKDLSGWDGIDKFWSVRDGLITGQTTKENPTKGNTFLIWKDGTVDDFELRFSYRIVGGNSGAQYRSRDLGNHVVGGYQADIDSGDTYSGILYEERGRGILAQRGQQTAVSKTGKVEVQKQLADTKELQSKIKKEDWNDYVVIAQGNHLIHKINGHVTADVTDNQPEKGAMSGILALQLHAGPPMMVQFRNIRIKRLPLTAGRKKIVLIAGRPSHGPGDHEFNAGVALMQKWFDKMPNVVAASYHGGWPNDPSAFDNADTLVFYMDGGARHPMIQGNRILELNKLIKQGIGLACLHYAVEVPAERGGPEFLEWIGGYYETGYSINPHWEADFKNLPTHEITRGVQPFKIVDEWYFNIRFPVDTKILQPILTATPSDNIRKTKAAAEHPGRAELLAWAIERPDGGRGFGFTGGHFHRNWGNADFRKLVVNAILWTAKMPIPSDGISTSVTPEELQQNLDPK